LDSTGGASGRNAVAAVLFMQAGMTVFDTYSTLNSSPWTAENVGADPEKMASLREYVAHAAGFSTAMCVASAVIAGSAWPIWGAVIANGYLVWIYKRAADRGKAAGSDGKGWFGSSGWGGGQGA
jgi:hypothetical protein